MFAAYGALAIDLEQNDLYLLSLHHIKYTTNARHFGVWHLSFVGYFETALLYSIVSVKYPSGFTKRGKRIKNSPEKS